MCPGDFWLNLVVTSDPEFGFSRDRFRVDRDACRARISGKGLYGNGADETDVRYGWQNYIRFGRYFNLSRVGGSRARQLSVLLKYQLGKAGAHKSVSVFDH